MSETRVRPMAVRERRGLLVGSALACAYALAVVLGAPCLAEDGPWPAMIASTVIGVVTGSFSWNAAVRLAKWLLVLSVVMTLGSCTISKFAGLFLISGVLLVLPLLVGAGLAAQFADGFASHEPSGSP